jgi:mannose-6-phosphate isomerase-like protein (cupin superfamily)
MSYLGERGEVSAVFHPVTEQPQRLGVGRIVATGATTNGDFGLFRGEILARTNGPSAHFHRTFSESFYVLSGTASVYDGQRWADASSGDFVYVPRGGIHALNNEGDQVVQMLVVFSPGVPRERFAEELIAIMESGRQLSPEEWTEFYARHDQYMV